jgi:uncharacterized flavoprotein (TIGR03862 family)
MAAGRVGVVGGGPAGLIAAETLAQLGHDVVVYEQMRSVGRKFLVAGRGGLNLTHSEPIDDLLDRYGSVRTHLEGAIRAFSPDDLRAWSESLGHPTFVGSSGRVFPESFRANTLLRAWFARLESLGVRFKTRHRWVGWAGPTDLVIVNDRGEQTVEQHDAVIVALGGASWPRTGSDAGWVGLFEERGVAVNTFRPANCGFEVRWSRVFADKFAGTPLKNLVVTVGVHRAEGEAVVSDYGIEGGVIYALSAPMRDAIEEQGSVTVALDLRRDVTIEELTSRLNARRPKESTGTALRRCAGLDAVGVGLLREATANMLPSNAAELAGLIKATPIVLTAPRPIERAISSAGGVSFDEVDDAFMLHKVPGVFVAGEMLDWEAPTGGYLLQASMSTGVAAARGVNAWLSR